MIEYFIPYLLFTQYSFNDPNVYYDPQYVFNYTINHEHKSQNSIYHKNFFATLKCQNLNSTSLICIIENPKVQDYEEMEDLKSNMLEPKYRLANCKELNICHPFEIIFGEDGVNQVSENVQWNNSYSILSQTVDLLNIQWINKIKPENGLYSYQEKNTFGSWNFSVKVIKSKENEHDIDNKDLYTIEKIGNFNGMKLNYKKTRREPSNIWNHLINDTIKRYFVHRAIMSAHEFISFIETRDDYTPHYGVISIKRTLLLTNIEPASDRIFIKHGIKYRPFNISFGMNYDEISLRDYLSKFTDKFDHYGKIIT
ncbi:uncharacterized protein [Chelonus insularis]|uniref:uncharacterized protein n=1 Tax=Chelonus insularis TaxID=460826 RepID=UPI0015884236|nr:uncharacterized protein LOC118065170 [Chelonus insularis]